MIKPSSTITARKMIIGFFPIIFLVLILLKANDISAQQLEWRYEYETGVNTHPAYFWIDADGNGFFNIKKTNPNYTRQYDRSHSLLILNKHGEYNGAVFTNQCERGGLLLPFPEDRYVLSGVDCKPDSNSFRKSYLLDYSGQILKEDRAFEGNYFAQTPSGKGYTYFSKPSGHFSHTFLSIGSVNKNFKISNDSISLKPIEKEGLGMVFNYIAPVQLENKSWVMPFNYGRVGSGIKVDHGSVFCVKKEKILWQYPDTISSYKLSEIAGNKNTVTLLMRQSRNAVPKLFVQLDAKGKVIHSTSFRPKRQRIKDLESDDEHIILLSSNGIYWYNWNGELFREYDLTEAQVSANKMRLLSDGSIMVVGKNGGNCVIVKLSAEDFNIVQETEQELNSTIDPSQISYAEASLKSPEIFSASIFPNPTSFRINFEISGIADQTKLLQLEVFDNSGKKVFDDKLLSNFYELNVLDFAAGTYFYKITSIELNDATFISGKFIKIDG